MEGTTAGDDSDAYGVGEVRAIRTFRLGADGALYPLYDDRPWLSGTNTATCTRGRDHRAPAPDCRCGFYAYADPAWTVAQPPAVAVLAVVELWGTLEVATRGVRAEHGRLRAVWLHPRVPAPLVSAVRSRYPQVEVLRDREALLSRHPLTALQGYRPPRLSRPQRRRLTAVLGVLAALVVLIGCLPARHIIASPLGAGAWLAAFGGVCATVVAGLGMRSAAVGTAGVVGLGWMLSATGSSLATVWATRLPLLVAIAVSAALWLDLAAPGRPVPRRRQVAQVALSRFLARLRRPPA